MSILNSFKRRKIGQWSLAYITAAWVAVQLVDVLGGRWGITEGIARGFDLILITGFFLVLIVAWYHGDKGHQKVGGTELLLIALTLVAGSVGLFFEMRKADESMRPERTALSAESPSRHTEGAPWMAVLPFEAHGNSDDLKSFATNLAASINSGLSSFSHLLVLSRSVVENAAESLRDPREIGASVGARYLMEGDVRSIDDQLRLTVQLTDSTDGKTVWSTKSDFKLSDAASLQFQDAIAERIVATVGDSSGVVTRELANSIIPKSPESMTSYEAVLQWTVNRQVGGPEVHLRARTALERAVELEPEDAVAWACLAHVYTEEFMSNYNPLPNPLERGLVAARRAVALDRTDSLAHYSLAINRYFAKNIEAFRAAADRSIELNPNDASAVAMLGMLTSFSGDWDAGMEITKRAMQINPDHPGYYRFGIFYDQYRKGNGAEALDIALQINMPGYYVDALVRVLAYVQIGDFEAATKAAEELQALFPNFEADFGRLGVTNWFFAQPELIDEIANDLLKVGLSTDWTIY
ncbi:MAG: hypothetical protein HKN57_06805 [Xanthomonadales bacterium]|nr:hypothetical protein [Gammaproteobacteria bacterium]MBT8055228.1 hypothetical protein [Gammaproteobacteria bacterium]NND56942.1 hypothetical protein [Xanthomonadales bacterium]NNK51900.1 hypothetical protein [Xanthomonadales bacterium]